MKYLLRRMHSTGYKHSNTTTTAAVTTTGWYLSELWKLAINRGYNRQKIGDD